MEKTTIEKGKAIKAQQVVETCEFRALEDDKDYEVTRLVTPFGTYVIRIREAKQKN